MVLEVIAMTIRQDKDTKDSQIGKEEAKVSQFADDILTYTKNHKDSTEKLSE